MKIANFLQSCFFTVLLVGCSGDKVPMGGKVTFSDDGSSVPTGIVCFQKPGFVARGEIGPDGTYVMSSTGTNDGLPPGDYEVFLIGVEKPIPGQSLSVSLIDDKYGQPQTSGMRIMVDATTKRFDFQVDRAKKKP